MRYLTLLAVALSQASQASTLIPLPAQSAGLPVSTLNALSGAVSQGLTLIPQPSPEGFQTAVAIVLDTLSSGNPPTDPAASLAEGAAFFQQQFMAGAESTQALIYGVATGQASLLSEQGGSFAAGLRDAGLTTIATVNDVATGIANGAVALSPLDSALSQPDNAGILGSNGAAFSALVTGELADGYGRFFDNADRFASTLAALPADPAQGSSTIPALFAATGADVQNYFSGKAEALQARIHYESTQGRLSQASADRNPNLLPGIGNSMNRDFQRTLAGYNLKTPSINTGPLPAP